MVSLEIPQIESSGSQEKFAVGSSSYEESVADQLVACQPTRHDYEHTLKVIENCDQVIDKDPLNAIAYSDRAVALAFLGRDAQARQDCAQAAQLGAEPRLVNQEVKLVSKIAIDCSAWDDGRYSEATPNSRMSLVSVLLSLFSR